MENHSLKTSLISFLLFQMAFVSLSYVPFYDNIKYVCMIMIGLFLLIHYRVLAQTKIKKIHLVFFLYLGIVLLLSFINRGNTRLRNPFFSAVVYCAILFEAYFLMQYLALQGRFYQMIRTFYFLAWLYVIVTDILIFLKPALFLNSAGYYFIGNKFTVSFFHLFLTMLFVQKCRMEQKSKFQERVGLWLYLCLAFIIAASIQCATGIVGVILMLILFGFTERFLCRSVPFLVVMGVSAVVLLLYSNLMTNKFVQYIVVDVLHKDITLTGRMEIYQSIGKVMNGYWLLGYGYGSSYAICMKTIYAPNLQNGVLDYMMQMGLLSFALLLIIIIMVFRSVRKNKKPRSLVFPFVVLLYLYAILGAVEITISQNFLLLLLFVYVGCVAEKCPAPSKNTNQVKSRYLKGKTFYESAG